ncbi:protein kinase [Gemmatirosa kalamazoonensis]|uniref:Protein kinase n=1 Tax=Gemmatirosa kalamazoonensis TaxID=861299 RepID=W0RCI0_9BACT|nr:protein kinase [Gemmatirosa kalamazoonensis]
MRDLVDIALDLDADARTAFLRDACADDPEALREVQALLASFEGASTDRVSARLTRVDAGAVAIGDRIGPYVLRREIGSGGMGVVYEATREDVAKTVALKLVRYGWLASPDHLRRFRLEQRVLARLEHPNIARLLDVGVTDAGLPYLAMEYVAGEPIDRYCDARGLTIEQRLALFVQVCDAVQYAHRHLVVHRDLKPSNILVTATDAVKLLDFGIATLLEEGSDADGRITGTGLVVLTPEYASPEQVRGDPVTMASDVYALGLLLYELLTGSRPFRRPSRSTPELLLAVRDEEPALPSRVAKPARLARRLAGDLDTIVLQALRKEPERRYQSVQALREDVDRYLSGRPVRARGDSLGYRSRKFVRRHTAAVAAVVLVVLALAGGVVTTTVQARRADAERAVAEERFRDMRALAGALVSDVYDAIHDLPGTLPVRATLAGRALEHLQRLERETSDDPVLRREIAEAYLKLGHVQGSPTGANLGDLGAARESFRRALALARSLVAADSTDAASRRTLALAHEAMSDADAWRGDLPQGVSHARAAVDQWRVLAAADTSRVRARYAVAMSRVKLGDFLGNPNLPNVGDRAGATAQYREGLALMHAAPPDSLAEWSTRRLLALLHERLGAMLAADGRHAAAIAELEQALAIRDGLVKERAASVDARRDLAVVHQLLCEAQLAGGDDTGALARCERGLALYESLRAADPRNAQSARDLALGLQSMHKVLAARGALAEALAQLDRSAELSRALLRSQRDNVPARRDLAHALLFASRVHATLAARSTDAAGASAHRARAAVSYAEAEGVLGELRARGPLSREDSTLLAETRVKLAAAHRR